MNRSRILFRVVAPSRRRRRPVPWRGRLVGLALLALGGCAGPAPTPPSAPHAAMDPPAYMPARKVQAVSAALNRKLDRILAAPEPSAAH